ncbi:rhodanese-like domain-containing protein [Candidatus Azambacteria bacterium]|nr:rhodanese-like domain-containing protein [Candidatus Azambacteria bacterium]
METQTRSNFKKLFFALLTLAVIALIVMYFDGKRILEENGRLDMIRQEAKYENIIPETLNSMIQLKNKYDFVMINVDDAVGKIINPTDLFIGYDKVGERQKDLPSNKNIRIAVYSSTGMMGQIAAQKLILLGYKNVFNLSGGTKAWEEKGFPLK